MLRLSQTKNNFLFLESCPWRAGTTLFNSFGVLCSATTILSVRSGTGKVALYVNGHQPDFLDAPSCFVVLHQQPILASVGDPPHPPDVYGPCQPDHGPVSRPLEQDGSMEL